MKANVVFFECKPAAADPWTRATWVYDLRTNMHFTLKTKTLQYADLVDFVESYCPVDRSKCVESAGGFQQPARSRRTRRRDVEELEAALAQFAELAASLPIEPR